jgi:alkanesulfonate monooxygenase SsuD/methylene tetrahydromethanopterin reductase-like flavin-dependent oxidoreductase (luciferase family)
VRRRGGPEFNSAEQAAPLDLRSGGRLEFGIGKGYRYNEFAGFCVPMLETDARFDERLEVLRKAWTADEPFSHQGTYWAFDQIVVEPPTAQKPHHAALRCGGTAAVAVSRHPACRARRLFSVFMRPPLIFDCTAAAYCIASHT